MKRSMRFLLFLLILNPLLPDHLSAQGDNLFKNNTVHDMKLYSLKSSDWDSMVQRYYPKIYTPLKVEIDGTALDSVGVRIKGNGFYPPTMGRDKFQPFRLKFGKFKNGQRYDGLKDVNLHMHDLLTNFAGYDIWRLSDLAAPRTSFAKVWFDNAYLGMYMLVDEVDKTFLKRNFNNDGGNLFKADEKMANLAWLGWEQEVYKAYKLETNEDKNDKSDLIALLNNIHNRSDQDLPDSLSAHLNLNSFIKSMAIEMFLCKRDAFYDSGHNYFLYHNTSTGKFEYIPWDLDETFQSLDPFNLNFVTNSGPMSNPAIQKIITVPSLRNLYYQTTCNLIHSAALDKQRLIRLIDDTEAFLQQNGLSFSGSRGYSINQVKTFLTGRKSQIENDFLKYGFTCNPVTSADQNLPEDAIVLYPNPAGHILSFTGLNDNKFIKYQIFNLAGINISGGDFVDQIDITGLNEGVYILRLLSSDGKNLNIRFIKD